MSSPISVRGQGAAYTRGAIGPTMIRNALGMLMGTLAMSGYNIADSYFVGRLGATPQAAMAFTLPVIMLVSCVFRGVAGGITATTAHALGGRNRRRAIRLVTSGFMLATLVSAALAVLGLTAGAPLFRALGADGPALELTLEYMDVWFIGGVTAALSGVGNDVLLAVGAPRTASVFMLIGMVLNVALDPLFIFGWGPVPAMGIRGAAVATVITQGVATALVIAHLHRRYRLFSFRRMGMRALRALWRVIVRFGVPATLGGLMIPLGGAVVTWATAKFGDAAVAGAGTAQRLEVLAFMVPMAFGFTMIPMVGQNYGARLYSRIRECRRFSMRFALAYLTFAAVAFRFGADWLAGVFIKNPDTPTPDALAAAAEARRIMALYFRIVPWGFAMLEIHRFSTFVFTGCNRPGPAAWLNALRIGGLLIPFTLVAWYMDSLEGLFFARLAADVLAGSTGWFLASRLTRRLPEDGQPIEVRAWNQVGGI